MKSIAAGVALRLALSLTPLAQILERRPELNSPITSFRSLHEGVFLGDNAYDGGIFAHSPLYLALFKVIPLHAVIWIIADVISAISMRRIKRGAFLYLFNPYVLLSCVARSTTTLDNTLLLLCISATVQGDATAGLWLALVTQTSLYPMILLPLVVLSVRNRTWCVALFVGTMAMGLSRGIPKTWHVILTVSDLTPNVGMWWYFFTEMFDHFRGFFLGVFQFHIAIYVLPVCMRFSKEPLFGILILVGIMSTWKSYPTLGDLGLWTALLECFPEVVKNLRHPLFTATVYLYTFILLPLLHSLWLLTGTGNANFFYAATMVHGLNSCLAIVDILTAGMRRQVKTVTGHFEPVQFTGIE